MNSINSIVDGTIAGRYIVGKTVGVIGLFFTVVGIVSAISSVRPDYYIHASKALIVIAD